MGRHRPRSDPRRGLGHRAPDELPEALATLRGVLEEEGSILVSYFTGPRFEAFSHPAAPAYRWPPTDMARALGLAGLEVTGQRYDPQARHAYVVAASGPRRARFRSDSGP